MAKTNRKEVEDYFEKSMLSYDKYKKDNLETNPNLYQKIIHSESDYAPQQHMEIQEYIYIIKAQRKIRYTKNYNTHIDTPKGCWYTHKRPDGCFMCDDMQMITVLCQALEFLAKKYPKLTF